ncbi:sensory neuron membrane protein 2 [Bombyx mori]|uniref:Sensory neuron membrane protein 2 n=1 Tax=Bombyx mori TaxID=7091 RepID=A0A8R1WRT2_BOMMO|nr:sensory neuron membrane protein 2 [Bombyx mori]
MCGIVVSIVILVVGASLVLVSTIVGFAVVPGIVENMIIDSVVLSDDSQQFERFQEVPFGLNFSVTLFNIENPAEVLEGGVPNLTERGPYIYRLRQNRIISNEEEDKLTYNRLENFEFNERASFPFTEDDIVTITNTPYHAILQVAESAFPEMASFLPMVMNGIFGQNNNAPIIDIRVGDLLFDGIPLCKDADLIGRVACNLIRNMTETSQNIETQDDGSMLFTVLAYKQNKPTAPYKVLRGLNDHTDLGRILSYNERSSLEYWVDEVDEEGESIEPSICNTIKGTDSAIFPPFVDTGNSIFALNADICRSVELRYQYDTEYEGIPTKRFSANEWFLDNEDGCYCLNVTKGITQENGCLLRGTMELFTCSGAFMVLSYPHFLYADPIYRNGVVGMNPVEDKHRIMLDIEPNTGTPVVGAKRAQFNIFIRPISGIVATDNIKTTLMPLFWVEETSRLPLNFVEEIQGRLLRPLNLLSILIPVIVAICFVILVIGILVTIRASSKRNKIKQ